MKVTENALGQPPPDLRFFHTTTVTIAGRTVGALRHGMVGQPGWELFGPWEDRGGRARGAGRRRRGPRALRCRRPGVLVEHGGIGLDPSPLPAVYSGDELEGVPRVAAGDGIRGHLRRSAAASTPTTIEDYYFTPWDLGYGSYVKFDHDFVGREALERMAEDEHRQKVTLALDDEDVTRMIGTMFQKSDRAKFMDWPAAVYSMHQYDKVTVDGETVGVSTWIAYSSNEGKMLTLAVLDAEYAEPGTR